MIRRTACVLALLALPAAAHAQTSQLSATMTITQSVDATRMVADLESAPRVDEPAARQAFRRIEAEGPRGATPRTVLISRVAERPDDHDRTWVVAPL